MRDYGNGISDKMKANIFNKRSRTINSDRKIAGTGLGLPICKRIIEIHGGNIVLDTDSNGSAFTITLPLAQNS